MQLTEIDRRGSAGPVSYLDVEDWRARSGAFESIIIYGNSSKTRQNVTEPERLASVWSDRGLFAMLGVAPAAGRTFRSDDPANVVVVSAALAKRLGGSAAAVGQKLTLDGEPFTVIGVAPAGFQFPYRAAQTDLWMPWNGPPQTPNRDYQVDSVAARLKPGITIQPAGDRLNAIEGRRTAVIAPLQEAITGRVRPALLTLLGAVGMVLLIACVNVTSLLLACAAGRTHEMAVRIALGASRGRLIRQLLTESILIGTAGGISGLILAQASTDMFVKLAASRIPRSWEIGLDWRVFLFLLAVCLVTGIAFGVAPALAASNVDVQSGLKQGDGARAASGGSVRGRRFHDILVVAEIALACVLLVGAGVLMQAFLHLQSIPAGLAPDHALTARLAIALKDYPAPGSFGRYTQELQQRIQRIPGVRAAGFIQFLPLANWGWKGGFWPARQAHAETAVAPLAELRYVSPGYFRALGIPIRQGRDFTDRDTSDTPLVILVNEALARQYFPHSDAVGHATSRGTIVGVVGDVRQSGLDHPASPEIYYTFAQNTAATADAGVSVVVSTPLPPETLARALAGAIHEVNPNQAIFGIRTMRAVINRSRTSTCTSG